MNRHFYECEDVQEALQAYLKSYDNLYDQVKNASLRRFLLKHLAPATGKTVLDAGSGGGIWTRFWLDAGARVTAIDLRRPLLEANRTWNPEADFIQGDAYLQYLGKKFDIIFAKDVVEHIEEDDVFFKNAAGHLSDDGYLVLTTQNRCSLNFLLEGMYHLARGNWRWRGWDPTHVRFYDCWHLRRRLKEAGLVAEAWWGTYYLPYLRLSRVVPEKLLSWKGCHLLELFHLNDKFPFSVTGWNIGVIAKKLPV